MEVVSGVFCILALLVLAFFGELTDLPPEGVDALLESVFERVVDVDVGTDKERVVLPHVNHVLGVSQQVLERLAKGGGGAFETLDKALLHEPG